MTPGEMKLLVQQLHDIWNTGEVSNVPNVYSENFVVHWLSGVPPYDSYGQAGAIASIEETREAFPDWYENVLDMVIGSDRVVTRYVSTGTHEGIYAGIKPTNRKVTLNEMSIYRIENKRVIEQWCVDNLMSLIAQISDE